MRDKQEETVSSQLPQNMEDNILTAKLVSFDRNSIGSHYDNLINQVVSDGNESDQTDEFHESDIEMKEGSSKEVDVWSNKTDTTACEDNHSLLAAREMLKNIPANLVRMFSITAMMMNRFYEDRLSYIYLAIYLSLKSSLNDLKHNLDNCCSIYNPLVIFSYCIKPQTGNICL